MTGRRVAATPRAAEPASAPTAGADHRRPAGMCVGPGHLIVYGNPAFVAAFGRESVGLPAREALLGVPREGFTVMDAVFQGGRPLARWIDRDGEEWRLTVMPRLDPETREAYGVAFHLRARSDLAVPADDRRERAVDGLAGVANARAGGGDSGASSGNPPASSDGPLPP